MRFLRLSNALRTVALVEAIKGVLVLVVGFGVLSIAHGDVERLGERLIAHLHLNPAKHYPQIFIEAMDHLTEAHLWTLAIAALAYSLVRFIEAYGLWTEKR